MKSIGGDAATTNTTIAGHTRLVAAKLLHRKLEGRFESSAKADTTAAPAKSVASPICKYVNR